MSSHISFFFFFNVLFHRKYPYCSHRGSFFLVCTPHPSGNSSLGSYFSLKIVAFKNQLPLDIPSDPLGWGHGYFLEPHNVLSNVFQALAKVITACNYNICIDMNSQVLLCPSALPVQTTNTNRAENKKQSVFGC